MKPGDVVRHRQQNVQMTVVKVTDNGAFCQWFVGDKDLYVAHFSKREFAEDAVVVVPKELHGRLAESQVLHQFAKLRSSSKGMRVFKSLTFRQNL